MCGRGATTKMAPMSFATVSAYDAVREALAAQRCVMLDGAVATELPEEALTAGPHGERLWGAYLMLLSILSQERTADLLEQNGLQGEVVDVAFLPFAGQFRESQEQIERVEGLSDAYHLRIGSSDVMVAYLVKVSRR